MRRPLRRIVEIVEAEARTTLTFLGEEELRQPLFMLPQSLELPVLRRDQVAKRAEAIGDLLLLVVILWQIECAV